MAAKTFFGLKISDLMTFLGLKSLQQLFGGEGF